VKLQKGGADHRPDRCRKLGKVCPAWRSDKAVENLAIRVFKILMSHAFSTLMRWSKFSKFHFISPWVTYPWNLQVGIENSGWINESASLRYPNGWTNMRKLGPLFTLNRGFWSNWPFQVELGNWPEITVLELKRNKGLFVWLKLKSGFLFKVDGYFGSCQLCEHINFMDEKNYPVQVLPDERRI